MAGTAFTRVVIAMENSAAATSTRTRRGAGDWHGNVFWHEPPIRPSPKVFRSDHEEDLDNYLKGGPRSTDSTKPSGWNLKISNCTEAVKPRGYGSEILKRPEFIREFFGPNLNSSEYVKPNPWVRNSNEGVKPNPYVMKYAISGSTDQPVIMDCYEAARRYKTARSYEVKVEYYGKRQESSWN